MYQSIPSLTISPPRATPAIRTSHYPGDRGFELEKFSTVLKEKCRNFSICFKETGSRLKSRCSCAVSYQFLQKQQTFIVSVITWTIFGHFGHFDKIFRSSRVIFANARSSLKFWVSYYIAGLSLTFGLFQGYSPRVFLMYIHARKPLKK